MQHWVNSEVAAGAAGIIGRVTGEAGPHGVGVGAGVEAAQAHTGQRCDAARIAGRGADTRDAAGLVQGERDGLAGQRRATRCYSCSQGGRTSVGPSDLRVERLAV